MSKENTILNALKAKIKALSLVKLCIIYGNGTSYDMGNKSPICILKVTNGLSITGSGKIDSTMQIECIILTKDNINSRMLNHLLVINALKYMLLSDNHISETVCSTTNFAYQFGIDGGLPLDNSGSGMSANKMASVFSFEVYYQQNYTQ